MKPITWIDLSSVGARAFLLEQPDSAPLGERRLLLVRDGDAMGESLSALGFRRHARNDVWVRPAAGLTLTTLSEGLPGAVLRTMPAGEVVRRLGASLDMGQFAPPASHGERAPSPGEAPSGGREEIPASEDLAPSDAPQAAPFDRRAEGDVIERLGVNHLDETVWVHPERGRFVTRGETLVTEMKSSPSPRFLRVSTAGDATLLLAAMVRRAMSGAAGHVTEPEWSAFVEATRPEGASSREWARGLAARLSDVAIAELLRGREGYRDVFDAATSFVEGFQALPSILREAPELTPFFRFPAAFAFQRVVAQSAGGAGAVAVRSPRPAALLGLFDPETRIVPFGAVSSGGVDEAVERAVIDVGRAGFREDVGEPFDAILFEGRGSRIDVTDLGGFVTERGDFVELTELLRRRRRDGVLLALLEMPREPDAEVEAFTRWLGRSYAIEGRADIGGHLWGGGRRIMAIAIGEERPAPVAEPPADAWRIAQVDTGEDLWSWASDLLAVRAAIRRSHQGQTGEAGEADEAVLQLRYSSASRLRPSTAAVSRAFSGPIAEALARLQARCAEVHGVPDVDALVARELGVSRERLAEILSPEQVDAVGLAIDAEHRGGGGFLLGDQMGLGKGRTLAAMMARALRQGRKVLFLTERAINIPDIVRDFRDIGMWELCRPLILNRDVTLRDEHGEPLASDTDEERERLLRDFDWPEGRNIVLGTYSQISADVARAPDDEPTGVRLRSQWVRQTMQRDIFVVLDESHNVARATSNAADNLLAGIHRAGFVMYSSGTWAKNASSLDIYANLLPAGVSRKDITDLLGRGGLPAQEIFSAMLARDGLFIARQHDLSNCRFEIAEVSPEENARIMLAMDRLSDVLAEMALLSRETDRRVGRYNAALYDILTERFGEDEVRRDAQMRRLGLRRASMGSPLYEISRAFLASVLADSAARLGVEALDRGEKPVFLFDRTMGALLAEAKALRESGEAEGAPDFRDFLRRLAHRMVRIDGQGVERLRHMLDEPDWPLAAERMLTALAEAHPERLAPDDVPAALVRAMGKVAVDWTGAPEALATSAEFLEGRLQVALAATGGAVSRSLWDTVETYLPLTAERGLRRVMRLIDLLPPLPLSAIDRVKDVIEAEGRRRAAEGRLDRPWTIGEITGRSVELRDGEFRAIPKLDRRRIADDFQNGEIDALIINAAGATGIDLHAADKYPDRRPRVMIEVQAPIDITRQIQAYGRVNRLGQIHPPRIVTLATGLPIEARLLAMRNTKLRRLSASVTGSRENAGVLEHVPDIMNAVGDMVCDRYFRLRPDLLERMGLSPDAVEEAREADGEDAIGVDDAPDARRAASRYLARLALLPVAWQERVLREITNEYRAAIEELDVRGRNPLREEVLDGVVETIERSLFDGVPDQVASCFHEPTHVEKVRIVSRRRPMGWMEVMRAIEDAEAKAALSGRSPGRIADMLRARRDAYLESLLPAGVGSLEAALAARNSTVVKMACRVDRLIDFLGTVKPGSSLSLDRDGRETSAIVLDISVPEGSKVGGAMFHPGSYRVKLALPGLSKPLDLSLSALLSFGNAAPGDGVHGPDRDNLRMEFVLKEGREVSEERLVLTGNLLSAMTTNIRQGLGRLVTWRRADGTYEKGILISRRHQDLQFLPVRVTDAEVVLRAFSIDDAVKAYSTPELSNHGVRIQRVRGNGYIIVFPKESCRRFGHLHYVGGIGRWLESAASIGCPGVRLENKSSMLRIEVDNERRALGMFMELLGELEKAGHSFYFASRYREYMNHLTEQVVKEREAVRDRWRRDREFIENGPSLPDMAERRVA